MPARAHPQCFRQGGGEDIIKIDDERQKSYEPFLYTKKYNQRVRFGKAPAGVKLQQDPVKFQPDPDQDLNMVIILDGN